eukprot:gene10196-2615_t
MTKQKDTKRSILSIIGESIYIWGSILALYIIGFYLNYQIILNSQWKLPEFIRKGFSISIKSNTNFIIEITNPPYWIFFLLNLILLLIIILIFKISQIISEKGDIEELFIIERSLERNSLLGRLYGCYRNELENISIFGFTLLISTQFGINHSLISKFSSIYFLTRLLFHLFYILNLSTFRSISFIFGLTNNILLMILSSSIIKVSDIKFV